VEFKGGKTSIKVSGTKYGDPNDESTPAGIKLDTDLFIEGGELTIKSIDKEAKGINMDNGVISAGKVNIEAGGDGIKVHGSNKGLEVKGGTIYIKSTTKGQAIDGKYRKTGGAMTLVAKGSEMIVPDEF